MFFPSIYFKRRAKSSLQDEWQIPLLVTFFAGSLSLLQELLFTVKLPDTSLLANGQMDAFLLELMSVNQPTWLLMLTVSVLNFVFTPVLILSSNRYYLNRMLGEPTSLLEGLFSRFRYLPKALWLYIQIFVRVFLWSLLFIIPGILAALRYCMAFYFLADDPTLSASQAIAKSKALMKKKGLKPSYVMLLISFVGWSLLSTVATDLLAQIIPVVSTVVALALQLFISTYLSACQAAFYTILTDETETEMVTHEIRQQLRSMGMPDSQFGPEDEETEDGESQKDDEGDDQP